MSSEFPQFRDFDGKRYERVFTTSSKTTARETASRHRKRGNLARVVKVDSRKYLVYFRRRIRS